MSAFLCSPATITAAAAATVQAWDFNDRYRIARRSQDVMRMARIYLNLNIQSLRERYADYESLVWHGEVEDDLDFLPEQTDARTFVMFQALSCLAYQACEGSASEETAYHAIAVAENAYKLHAPWLTRTDLPALWDLNINHAGDLVERDGMPLNIEFQLNKLNINRSAPQ